ncbi:MAG: tRNA (adenosine(37)-N6)-dimethylallyltransferase MiaA [Candidatus Omnitrophica bacterium]|nr:tRNA (adenosine(37)-N6)-dimethylallyltransferase MiaA [Candidatus Omnitrophota bacterium]
MRAKVIFLVGPTATGKSELGIKLASRIKGEIISCDSMQVYKGMEILSAVLPPVLRKKIRHHLVSYVSPKYEYNVVKFQRDAIKILKDIIKRGKIPIFIGGSGLYYKVLLDGIFTQQTHDKRLREKLYKEAKAYSSYFLYEKLKRIDPQSSAKIHPHDLKRIIRAIEVYEKTGIPISTWQKRTKGIINEYDVRIFGLLRSKDVIFKRIQERTERMFRAGVVEEIKRLLRVKLSKTAQQAVGIKEISGYLNSLYPLEEAKRLIVSNTLKLVKKQLTWFKRDKRINWINIRDNQTDDEVIKIILDEIKN